MSTIHARTKTESGIVTVTGTAGTITINSGSLLDVSLLNPLTIQSLNVLSDFRIVGVGDNAVVNYASAGICYEVFNGLVKTGPSSIFSVYRLGAITTVNTLTAGTPDNKSYFTFNLPWTSPTTLTYVFAWKLDMKILYTDNVA